MAAASLLLHVSLFIGLSLNQRHPPQRVAQARSIYAMFIVAADAAASRTAAAPGQPQASTAPAKAARAQAKPPRRSKPVVPASAEPPPLPAPSEEPARAPAAIAAAATAEHHRAEQKPVEQYQYARRSLAFGGGRPREERAEAESPRALAPMLADAMARSVWAVVNEVLGAADGHCEVLAAAATDTPVPQIECSDPALVAALSRVDPDKLTALGSWLRGGYVRAIELRFEAGRASFSTRG